MPWRQTAGLEQKSTVHFQIRIDSTALLWYTSLLRKPGQQRDSGIFESQVLAELLTTGNREGITWQRRLSYVRKFPVTPSPKYYSFHNFATPAISIPLRNFRRLERRKTGKIAPKSYSCYRNSVSCAAADRKAYTAQKAAASPCWRCGFVFLRGNGSPQLQGVVMLLNCTHFFGQYPGIMGAETRNENGRLRR